MINRGAFKTLSQNQVSTPCNDVMQAVNVLFLGTIFLWLFWPSFNAGTAADEGQLRAIVNTYYSLTASAIVTFAVSSLVNKDKFNMVKKFFFVD
jgi:ammonia channel protein AmtB